jgi:hypothetical protein
MKRRQLLKTLTAGLLALPGLGFGASKGRFRPAICGYSFRNQLKDGSFTYADLIRMAADLGVDGVDQEDWVAVGGDQSRYRQFSGQRVRAN